jgi:hypothetical protein
MISPYFSVLSETKDFVCVQLNGKAEFNGTPINRLNAEKMPELYQHFLDEHGLVLTAKSESIIFPCKFIFRKVESHAQLVDKLHRMGALG